MNKNNKPSILFVVDKPKWAYEYMVKTWFEIISDEYDCYITYQEDFLLKKANKAHIFSLKNGHNLNFFNGLRLFISKIFKQEKKFYFMHKSGNYLYPVYSYDRVFDMKDSKRVSKKSFDYVIDMAFYFSYTAEIPFKGTKNIVGIFTDSFPHDGPNMDLKNDIDRNTLEREEFYTQYLKDYDSIIVGGGNLYDNYRKFTDKIHFVYGIYGQENFVENNSVGEKEGLIIGWTGSPKREMKGFESIIVPAIENVQKTGRKIELKTKFSGDYEELYGFYKDVDLIVIASSADSGPSLFAEASLSRVPCVSTKVGLPLTVITDNRNGLFITRDIESLEKAIIKLYDDRSLLKEFSKNIKQDYLKIMDNHVTVKYFLQSLQD